jgi:hypothetical protein
MNPQPPRCVCRKGGWNPRCPLHPRSPVRFGSPTPELDQLLDRVLRGVSTVLARGFGNEPAGSIGERELEDGSWK